MTGEQTAQGDGDMRATAGCSTPENTLNNSGIRCLREVHNKTAVKEYPNDIAVLRLKRTTQAVENTTATGAIRGCSVAGFLREDEAKVGAFCGIVRDVLCVAKNRLNFPQERAA